MRRSFRTTVAAAVVAGGVPVAGAAHPTRSGFVLAALVAAAVVWYTESTVLALTAGMGMIRAVELLA